jgi:hypothetical protein
VCRSGGLCVAADRAAHQAREAPEVRVGVDRPCDGVHDDQPLDHPRVSPGERQADRSSPVLHERCHRIELEGLDELRDDGGVLLRRYP